MQGKDDFERHARLMDSMATTLGIDLQEAAIRGDISIDDITEAVLRCTGCPDPDHCTGWLNDHARGAEQTPGYCRNRALLDQLRPGAV